MFLFWRIIGEQSLKALKNKDFFDFLLGSNPPLPTKRNHNIDTKNIGIMAFLLPKWGGALFP